MYRRNITLLLQTNKNGMLYLVKYFFIEIELPKQKS